MALGDLHETLRARFGDNVRTRSSSNPSAASSRCQLRPAPPRSPRGLQRRTRRRRRRPRPVESRLGLMMPPSSALSSSRRSASRILLGVRRIWRDWTAASSAPKKPRSANATSPSASAPTSSPSSATRTAPSVRPATTTVSPSPRGAAPASPRRPVCGRSADHAATWLAGTGRAQEIALRLVAAELAPNRCCAVVSTPSAVTRMPSDLPSPITERTIAWLSRSLGQPADERAVDLDLAEREALQIAQRRIARAEIVERNADTPIPQLNAQRCSACGVLASARSR